MTSAASGIAGASAIDELQHNRAINFGIITIRENGRDVQKQVMVTLLNADGEAVAPNRGMEGAQFNQLKAYVNELAQDLIYNHTNRVAREEDGFYQNRTIVALNDGGVTSSLEGREETKKYVRDQELPRWTLIKNSILGYFNGAERALPSHQTSSRLSGPASSENAFASNSDDDDSDGGFDTAARPSRRSRFLAPTTQFTQRAVEPDDLLTRLNVLTNRPTSLKLEFMPVPEHPPVGQPSIPGRGVDGRAIIGAAVNRPRRARKGETASTLKRAPVDETATKGVRFAETLSPQENKGANGYQYLAPVPRQKRTGNGGGIASSGNGAAINVQLLLQELDALDPQ